jgi:hypothetical protein
MPHSSKSAVKGSAIKKGIKSRITTAALGRVALTLALSINALGQTSSNTPTSPGASTEELQKATQNPVASLISVPFQNNVDENIGPYARERNTFNIQPVFPTQLSKSWNLISRIITPLIYQPFVSPGSPDLYAQKHLGAFGLGDIQPTFFFASSKPSKVIWGAGPALLLPTATDDSLGSGKLCIGPSVVALVQPGHFTIGALASNLWSFAGSSDRAGVNTMSLQYFVNYNLSKGWFLTSAPILSANWNASSGNVWLVPFGGGLGRIFKIANQPVNGSISAYYNIIRHVALSHVATPVATGTAVSAGSQAKELVCGWLAKTSKRFLWFIKTIPVFATRAKTSDHRVQHQRPGSEVNRREASIKYLSLALEARSERWCIRSMSTLEGR